KLRATTARTIRARAPRAVAISSWPPLTRLGSPAAVAI
ncbi:MAG: hypothetical protein UX78_C0010G0001, partial [Candidatus Amesbacteria bacterium GW2011_GWA2_47_11]